MKHFSWTKSWAA